MADYLDHLIDKARQDVEGFAQAWEPIEVMHELIRLRLDQGLTQEEVAQRMHIARPRVAEMEKRPESVSFRRIVAYSNAVGCRLVVQRDEQADKRRDKAS
jgi:transcriptional regulator with XRE-family HTH domain